MNRRKCCSILYPTKNASIQKGLDVKMPNLTCIKDCRKNIILRVSMKPNNARTQSEWL